MVMFPCALLQWGAAEKKGGGGGGGEVPSGENAGPPKVLSLKELAFSGLVEEKKKKKKKKPGKQQQKTILYYDF